jgi:NADH-quinone oxidoreductase subunit M
MSLLTLLILVPLLAALLVVLIPGHYRFVIRLVAIAATLATLLLALTIFLKFQVSPLPFDGKPGGFQLEQLIPWVQSDFININYHVGVDGLNLGLVLMAAIVAFAATCVSWDIKTNEKMFYTLLLLMTGGALGAFCSLDLFFLYFFNELALVPTFIMIGVWGRGEQKNYAAYQITLYLTLGAMIALVGLIALYVGSGVNSLDLATLKAHFATNPLSAKSQHLIFPLLLFGFGILVGLFPFHSWAPLGYGAAPTATAMMHAGVLKKVGLYAIIRVALPFMPEAAGTWMHVLAWLCLGNILFCGWVAMRQKDLNMLIGNSSVAHMGFVFLGIASVSLIGLTGAVVIMVAHGLLAALSYALTGCVYSETKTLEISRLGGLLRKMPFIGAVMIASFMAGCGLPGFANFAGELLVMIGAWKGLSNFVVAAAWGGLVIGAIYMLRAVRAVLHGPVADKMDTVGEFTIKEPLPQDTGDLGFLGGVTKTFHSALGGNLWQVWRKLPYALLLVALLLFGFFPSILTDRIRPAIAEVVAAAKPKTVAVVDVKTPVAAVAAATPIALPTAQ